MSDSALKLIRMAVRPRHRVAPHQQVPSRCTRSITRPVRASSPKATTTWLSTTSLRISTPAAPNPCAIRRAWAQLPSISPASPLRPRAASAAQTSMPRARREHSGPKFIASRRSPGIR